MSVHYERLSSLDNSFLALESRSTHMHVGAVTIFSAGSFAMPEGGIDVERLKDFISSKLHMIPRYRQRIVRVPIEQHPVWVDDEHFNIDYHIRHIAVPRPGTDEELKRIAGRLMSQQIDRTKPMWEMVVVEGLEDGRFAIVTKIHHCMIDGLSGVDLMAVLMSLVPSEEIVPGPAYEPRPIPNGTELLVRETTRRITGSIGALRSARDVVGNVSDLFDSASNRLRAVGASLSAGWLVPTGKTPINGDIGPGRRFSWVDMPLTDVKAIKNKLGGTVNDVFLATVAGAVREFLLDQRNVDVADVDGIDFRVMAPVSVRGVDQNGTLGNQVAMWLAPAPGWRTRPDLAPRHRARRDRTSQGDEPGPRCCDARSRVHRSARNPGCARRQVGGECEAVQHDGHQRPGTAVPAVHARRPDGGFLPARAALGESRRRHCDVLVRRHGVMGHQWGLCRHA